jgi:hypothetical protein
MNEDMKTIIELISHAQPMESEPIAMFYLLILS